jgi:hypothetical protein
VSPRKSGRRRLFGKARKTVKIDGQTFKTVYTMNKVLVHTPAVRKSKGTYGSAIPAQKAKITGPYQTTFDYTPYMPRFSNGRWYPGKWLPLVPAPEQKMCMIGYHGCTMDHVQQWSDGYSKEKQRVWLIEGVGPMEHDPKSQEPLHTQVTYRFEGGHWMRGYYDYQKGEWIPPHQTTRKKVRNKNADKRRNDIVEKAKENGGFVYEPTVEKYNFQSIRILKPLTSAPKRTKKSRKVETITRSTVDGKTVKVSARSGRVIPGQGARRKKLRPRAETIYIYKNRQAIVVYRKSQRRVPNKFLSYNRAHYPQYGRHVYLMAS